MKRRIGYRVSESVIARRPHILLSHDGSLVSLLSPLTKAVSQPIAERSALGYVSHPPLDLSSTAFIFPPSLMLIADCVRHIRAQWRIGTLRLWEADFI